MLEEYKKENPDMHKRTGSLLYNIPLEEVTDDQRRDGKNANYGIVYGISPRGFSSRWGGTEERAKEIIDGWRRSYKRANSFMYESGLMGLTEGYSETVIGRRRYFEIPPLGHQDMNRRMAIIRRASANHPIQGTAAEIMKQAIYRTHKEIEQYNAHIVNIVHDEVVIEGPKGVTSELIGVVYNEMRKAGEDIMGDELDWSISLAFGKCWKKS